MCTVVHSRRHTINLYENFTYIGEVLLVKEDNTEGSRKMPVETKCEIAKQNLFCFGESYSPIPQVIVVRSLLLKRDNERSKI